MIICILLVVGVVVEVGGVGRVISVVTIVGVLAIVPLALSYSDMPFFLTYRVRRSYDDFTIISGRDLKVL
jgi:ABC-type glucose/galactose transport system permease subunit